MAGPLLALPHEVLKLVLTHVPLQDRLGSCSLVHTRLHAAAVAATQRVKLECTWAHQQPQRAQAVLDWLARHGQHVTSLEVWQYPLTQLPCPNLKELQHSIGSIQLGPTAGGCPGVITGVTNLTRLELQHVNVIDGPVVDSLSCLVHLQHLDWTLQAGGGAVSFSDTVLPPLRHLTYVSARLSLKNILQLCAPHCTALRNLRLELDTSVSVSLSSATGRMLPPSLTSLELTSSTDKPLLSALLSLAPTGLQALTVTWNGMEGSELPLSCVARLQCLTQLIVGAWPDVRAPGATAWPPCEPAYSALTASSSLVSLQVYGDLPAGVWPFVFPATRQLPHFTYLAFDEDYPDVPWAFDAADLASLVSCCPGLRMIYYMCLLPGAHVSELRTLTALTYLDAYCDGGDSEGVIQGLAAVTQLKHLVVDLGRPPGPMTMASLLPLTSLTALTRLQCTWGSNDDGADDEWTETALRTQAGSPPDVWLRLLERCAAADPSCQPTVLRDLAQQLAQQRALTTQQQQQLAEQAERIAALEGRVRQVAGHEEVMAQQRERIAALEGLVQQLLQRLP